MGKKILVTGGAGFIGSHLVKRLMSDRSNQITVLDNFDPFYDISIKKENIERFSGNPQFTLVEEDVRNIHGMRKQLDGNYDVIVHLAAKAGVRTSLQDPLTYQDVNVKGTQNLLELAREWGVKQFIFASSSSVYGINPKVPWNEEDHVLLPISPYASTKVSGELLGHVYSHLYGIRFIALRFFTVYGPCQRPDLAIHKFARRMIERKSIPVYGDGSSRRDYTYIDDIINGIIAAMDYNKSNFEVFNLGNNKTISLLEMIHLLASALNVEPKIDFLPQQQGDVYQTWADIRKAQTLLGYNPSTDFKTGIERFCKWLKIKLMEKIK